MTGARARQRAELTEEIKRLARRQLDEVGAINLSLRAIARDLGMVSSAIYRYFPSRDDLLTALIIDAYEAIGAEAEAADIALVDRHPRARWRTACRSAYDWARAHPAEFALIYGTPVPGYQAPPDTIGPAQRFTAVLNRVLEDAEPRPSPRPSGFAGRALDDVTGLAGRLGGRIDPDHLALGLHLWISLIGTISFVLFGHLHNVVDDHDAVFDATVELLGDEIFPPG
jgi:AcrR family transcriptional regulator